MVMLLFYFLLYFTRYWEEKQEQFGNGTEGNVTVQYILFYFTRYCGEKQEQFGNGKEGNVTVQYNTYNIINWGLMIKNVNEQSFYKT